MTISRRRSVSAVERERVGTRIGDQRTTSVAKPRTAQPRRAPARRAPDRPHLLDRTVTPDHRTNKGRSEPSTLEPAVVRSASANTSDVDVLRRDPSKQELVARLAQLHGMHGEVAVVAQLEERSPRRRCPNRPGRSPESWVGRRRGRDQPSRSRGRRGWRTSSSVIPCFRADRWTSTQRHRTTK